MIQLGVAVIAAGMIFGGGYKTRSMIQDGIDLKAVEQMEVFKARESEIAKTVADQLQVRDNKVEIITKWRTKYVTRPVYSNSCIDDDGLRVIESYASNNARNLVSEMPDGATEP